MVLVAVTGVIHDNVMTMMIIDHISIVRGRIVDLRVETNQVCFAHMNNICDLQFSSCFIR